MNLLVTGTDGLIGSAIAQMTDAVCVGHSLDLTDSRTVAGVFQAKPTHVIHCAARVGGYQRNHDEPEAMFCSNTLMNTLVVHEAAASGVEHLVAFGSNCAFDPSLTTADETNIHEGEPYENNRTYGYAKRMLDVHLEAAQKQYGMTSTYIVPPSMYGPNDNFGEGGHVVASLIRRAFEARMCGKDELEVWGSGQAVRDVAYSEDVARVAVECLETKPRRLVMGGESLSIREMASVIASVVGIRVIRWRADKPNGQLRRPMVKSSGLPTRFREGVEKTVAWMTKHWPNVRGA